VHSTNLESLRLLVGIFAFLEFFFFHLALLIVFVLWLGRKVLHELAAFRSEWRSADIFGSRGELHHKSARSPAPLP
jgi:hypothetical protein